MIKLGGTGSASHLSAFKGLEAHFKDLGIEVEWVLYSDDMAVVQAFVEGEIDIAWNGPLNYVRIKTQLQEACHVLAMRDVDIDVVTHFVTASTSDVYTLTDLVERNFAFGSRGSVETGLLAHHFLRKFGVDPEVDLQSATFFEERQELGFTPELDVLSRVISGECDAGAVSGPTLDRLIREETIDPSEIRVIWTSESYSHCCFTAQSSMEVELVDRLREGFEAIDADNSVGRAILEAEGCDRIISGQAVGWDVIEEAAREQRLI